MAKWDSDLMTAIERAYSSACTRLINEGVPIGVDAVHCSILLHTPHGWQSPINGEIVDLPKDAGDQQISQASHHSGS